jgi:predicted ATPase
LSFAATLHELRRDWRLAREIGDEAFALATQHGFSQFAIMAQLFRGSAQIEEGDPETGRATLTSAARAAETAGAELLHTYSTGMIARAPAKAGRLDEARTLVDEALAIARQTGEHFYDAELHRLRGEFLVPDGGPEAIARTEACFRQTIEVATTQRAPSWKLRTAVSLARLVGTGQTGADALRILDDTYRSFTEGFDSPDLRDARALLHPHVVSDTSTESGPGSTMPAAHTLGYGPRRTAEQLHKDLAGVKRYRDS